MEDCGAENITPGASAIKRLATVIDSAVCNLVLSNLSSRGGLEDSTLRVGPKMLD
jgi:hypothetical protein